MIGIWGGPERRYAARKFFIYTLAGSFITLFGVLGVVICLLRATGVTDFSIPELVEIVHTQLASSIIPRRKLVLAAVPVWVFSWR